MMLITKLNRYVAIIAEAFALLQGKGDRMNKSVMPCILVLCLMVMLGCVKQEDPYGESPRGNYSYGNPSNGYTGGSTSPTSPPPPISRPLPAQDTSRPDTYYGSFTVTITSGYDRGQKHHGHFSCPLIDLNPNKAIQRLPVDSLYFNYKSWSFTRDAANDTRYLYASALFRYGKFIELRFIGSASGNWFALNTGHHGAYYYAAPYFKYNGGYGQVVYKTTPISAAVHAAAIYSKDDDDEHDDGDDDGEHDDDEDSHDDDDGDDDGDDHDGDDCEEPNESGEEESDDDETEEPEEGSDDEESDEEEQAEIDEIIIVPANGRSQIIEHTGILIIEPDPQSRWNTSPYRWEDVGFQGHRHELYERATNRMYYMQLCYSLNGSYLKAINGKISIETNGSIYFAPSDYAGGGVLNNNEGSMRVKIIKVSAANN